MVYCHLFVIITNDFSSGRGNENMGTPLKLELTFFEDFGSFKLIKVFEKSIVCFLMMGIKIEIVIRVQASH